MTVFLALCHSSINDVNHVLVEVERQVHPNSSGFSTIYAVSQSEGPLIHLLLYVINIFFCCHNFQSKGSENVENEDEEDDEEEELGHTDTYAEYVPSKCKYMYFFIYIWTELIFVTEIVK